MGARTTLSLASSNGRFLAHFHLELGGIQHPRRVEVDHERIGRASLLRLPRGPGSPCGLMALIRVMKRQLALWT